MKNKYKKFILIIFLFQIFFSLFNCSNYISMKLYNYNNELIQSIPENYFTYEHFINITIQNPIFTSIKIGNPSQEVKAWIDSEEYSYFLYKDICTLDSYFDENSSSSFEPNYNNAFFYSGYGETIYINENFIFNSDINENNNKKIELKKFPIMFMKDPKNDKMFNYIHSFDDITNKTCATIGFKYMIGNNEKNAKNFILILKEKDIIDDYTIFIEYDKNGNEDYLIIGGYPEEIYNNKYNIKNQHSTYIHFYYEYINQWGLNFDKIYSGNEGKIYQVETAFHHNLGVIYGVQEYQSHIESNYFNYYINLKICEKKQYKDYTFYICNKDKFTIEEMRKFPELQFIKADLEEKFSLTYEDLFFIKGNQIYFLIVFHRILKKVWELGKPFLKKYTFTFNFDSKLIWYYKKISNNEEKEIIYDKSSQKETYIFICIIIVLSIIFGIISFMLGRILFKKNKKKKKAKELDQDFDFEYFDNVK